MAVPFVFNFSPCHMKDVFKAFCQFVSCLLLAWSSSGVLATDFGLAAAAAKSRANTHRQQVQELPAESLWGGVRDGQWHVVLRHLQAGVPVDSPAPTAQAHSPLLMALKLRQLEIAEKLLAHGADPMQRARDGFSALDFSFWAGIQERPERYDPRFMAALLRHGADPHAQAPHRQSLVLGVADHGLPVQPMAMAFLIEQGIDVKRAYLPDCLTPLHLAAKHADGAPLVRMLLEAGANPNALAIVNRNVHITLESPLAHALPHGVVPGSSAAFEREQKQLERIDLLLASGANPRWARWDVVSLSADKGCGPGGPVGWDKAPAPAGSSTGLSTSLDPVIYRSAARPDLFSRILAAVSPIQMGEVSHLPVSHLAIDLQQVRAQMRSLRSSKNAQSTVSAPDLVQELNFLGLQEKNLRAGLEKLVSIGAPIDPPVRLSAQGFERFWYSEGVVNNWVWGAPSLLSRAGISVYEQDDELFDYWLGLGASPFIYPEADSSNSLLYREVRSGNSRRLGKLVEHLDLAYKIPTWCRLSVQELKRGLQDSEPVVRQLKQPLVHATVERLQKTQACRP